MTNFETNLLEPSGTTGEYIRDMDVAAQYWISGQRRNGKEFLLVSDAYQIFGAETIAEKTSIRMAFRTCKNNGLIRVAPGYKGLGLYEVLC